MQPNAGYFNFNDCQKDEGSRVVGGGGGWRVEGVSVVDTLIKLEAILCIYPPLYHFPQAP